MEIQAMVEIINSVGFPIAACAALFWMNRENSQNYRKVLDDYRKTIEANTTAINSLINELRKH